MELLTDFAKGPLDHYRSQATFNWKKLKLIIDNEEIIKFKYGIWNTLEKDALFEHSSQPITHDDLRRITTLRYHRVRDYNFLPDEELLACPQKFMSNIVALNEYDANLLLKYIVPYGFFVSGLTNLGTDRHRGALAAAKRGDISGCFCLTEMGHGSNTSKMQTTAKYDRDADVFLLNTPNFEAAKCWAGGLGKSATHAVVYAQLHTADGVNQGLHGFLVPLRDTNTMITFPGVTIGDMGHKCGLNAMDNGFAVFNDYPIPRESLLNRTGDVTRDGEYLSPIKDPRKRVGASLGVLVVGRVVITNICAANLSHAAVIATRYSAVRRQFGDSPLGELPVLEYQLQQWRVIPLLAASFALKFLGDACCEGYIRLSMALATRDGDAADALGAELHGLAAAAKPLASWTAQRGIQECREACGGHGYLTCAGFSRLRNDNDANCTYEGENNVLIQQTSNWLLSLWHNRTSARATLPLGSALFVYCQPSERCAASTVKQLTSPAEILRTYEWLLHHLLDLTSSELKSHTSQHEDAFRARNNSQVYRARTLTLAFAEYYTIKCFWEQCCAESLACELRDVLTKLCSLYGLWCLEPHLASLYQGGYAGGVDLSHLVRQGVIDLCLALKNEAVSLADALAPTDFILNSALGHSDGQVYKNLQSAFLAAPEVTSRPAWWRQMVGRLRSRL